MSWRAQIIGSVLLAVALVAVAAGLARPIGQRCADADVLADHQLRDEAIAAYRALLKSTAPTCAAHGLQKQLALPVTKITTTTTTTKSTRVPGQQLQTSHSSQSSQSATPSPKNTSQILATTTATRPPRPPSGTEPIDHNLPESLDTISKAREWVEDLGLTVVGWVLIVLAAVLIVRAGALLFARALRGSIDLGSVTDAGDQPSGPSPSDSSDPAVVAQLQDRLAGRHLFGAAAMPSGAVPNAGSSKLSDALATAV